MKMATMVVTVKYDENKTNAAKVSDDVDFLVREATMGNIGNPDDHNYELVAVELDGVTSA